MFTKTAILASACTLIAFASVEPGNRLDLELKDGTKHIDARITAIDIDKLLIIDKGGAFTIKKDELNAESQKAIGWSKEASDEYKAKIEQTERQNRIESEQAEIQNARTRLRESKIAELNDLVQSMTIDATVYILQVSDGGFLCKGGFGKFGSTKTQEQKIPKVPAQYVDDEIIQTETLPGLDGPKTFTKRIKFKKLVTPEVKEKIEYTSYRDSYSFPNLFFVEAPTAGYVDEGVWTGRLWPNGTYSYLNTQGAKATVKKFTTNPPETVSKALGEITTIENTK
jgi:hypothetical protein